MNPVSRSAHEFSIEVAPCTPKPMFFFLPDPGRNPGKESTADRILIIGSQTS
jgi:hypothetical protein